jgi:uncharacterized repeat protein (TIGR03803 family)
MHWQSRNRPPIRALAIAGLMLGAAFAGAGSAQAWTLTTIHSFCSDSCYDGQGPSGGLAMDAAGNLYGTTQQGGINGYGGWGTVFELVWNPSKTRWDEHVTYNFCGSCKEGGYPTDVRPVVDTAGNLYGTTGYGGQRGGGTLFRLTPDSKGKRWSLSRLYDFCTKDSTCPDGLNPSGPLTYAGAETGALYDGTSPLFGTTWFGGKYRHGVAFSLVPTLKGKWKLKVLYAFCKDTRCKNGAGPRGLIADGTGNLYVAANYGGIHTKNVDGGTLLKLSTTDSKANRDALPLYRFCTLPKCVDGASPNGLTTDATGAFLGATFYGGANHEKKENCFGGCGALYRLTSDGSETPIFSFCNQDGCVDGRNPDGSLTLDSSGNLFGLTEGGGIITDNFHYGYGTVFEFDGSALQTLYKFCSLANCSDGSYPAGPLAMDSSGNLFGETTGGSFYNAGTVFELSP